MQSAVYSRIGLGICEILLLSSRSHHVMGRLKLFMLPACQYCQTRSYDIDKICI